MMQQGRDAKPRACPQWGVPQETVATCRGGENGRCQPSEAWGPDHCASLQCGPGLAVSFMLCPLEGKALLSWTANYSHRKPFQDNGRLTLKIMRIETVRHAFMEREAFKFAWQVEPISSESLQCAQDNEKCLKRGFP